MRAVISPLQAQIVLWQVQPGATVLPGELLVVLEAMKMEHEVRAPSAGRLTQVFFLAGEQVEAGSQLATIDEMASAVAPQAALSPEDVSISPSVLRQALQRVRQRHAKTTDASRVTALEKRHALGLRSARENIADLCDADSFMEYGALAVAAQRSRRSEEDLIENTPADGMVTGIGSINSALFDPEASRAVVMAYDATVLAGTQGMRNHQKTDRLLGIALQQKLPVLLFAEGGGGRPGDTDMPIVAGLHVGTFASFARLKGQVPVIGIAQAAVLRAMRRCWSAAT